ncbi:MAG: hypothetical protein QF682_03205 [Candidatus Thermoplasmatota archaeon]|jgi:sporulation protein YlmC with PRC-barrel domain|nr:hypothetical protein [Candidatus Thermoplasmatota archaeon]
MLYSRVKGFEFKKAIEGIIGKQVGMILNTNTWRVTHFVISHGMGKKAKNLIHEKYVNKFDMDNNLILLNDEHEEEEIPSTSKREMFMCKDFVGISVVSSDNKKIGKVTDFDMPEKLKIWKIWKIMIATGFKSRRLRISPEDIMSLGEEMVLRKTYDELFPSKEEEEEEQ